MLILLIILINEGKEMKTKVPIYIYTTRSRVVLAMIITFFIAIAAFVAGFFDSPVPLLTYIILGLFIYFTAVAKAAPFGDRLRVKPILGKRREYFVAQGTFSLAVKPTFISKLVGSDGSRILYTQDGRKPVVVMNEFFSPESITEIYEFLAYWQEEHAKADDIEEILE